MKYHARLMLEENVVRLEYIVKKGNGGYYGVEVLEVDHNGAIERNSVFPICKNRASALDIAKTLAKNTVTPTTLEYIIEDIKQEWEIKEVIQQEKAVIQTDLIR